MIIINNKPFPKQRLRSLHLKRRERFSSELLRRLLHQTLAKRWRSRTALTTSYLLYTSARQHHARPSSLSLYPMMAAVHRREASRRKPSNQSRIARRAGERTIIIRCLLWLALRLEKASCSNRAPISGRLPPNFPSQAKNNRRASHRVKQTLPKRRHR